MKQYKKNFLKANNLTTEDWVGCSKCGATAVDLHHDRKRSQLGTDDASNLVPLCRACHSTFHS